MLSDKYKTTIKTHYSYTVKCHQNTNRNGHDQYENKIKHK